MKKTMLIVGGGIAGISLARQFERKGISFELIDSGINHSSVVAAGLINPLVFRRMTLSWRIHDLLPETVQFYADLAKITGRNYLRPIPIRRAFAHDQERDFWLQKQNLPEFAPFMKSFDDDDANKQSVINLCGTGKVLQSYYVETAALFQDFMAYGEKQGWLRRETFVYELLDPEQGKYKDNTYEHIFFCEGYRGAENPWFNWLPLQCTKGEVLTLQSDELPEDESINRKCFVLPLGGKQFRVGSTYTWDSTDVNPTDDGKELILANLKHLSNATVAVMDHQAGIRPTVPDRRPMLGKHPIYKRLVILNGMGARGYVLAAGMSRELTEHVLDQKPLHPETDITRFMKHFKAD